MNNVIQHDFGPQAPVEQGIDAAWYFKNRERIKYAIMVSVDRMKALSEQQGFSRDAAKKWKKMLSALTLEAVAQHILEDRPELWRRNSSYYAALIIELNERYHAVGIAISDTRTIVEREEPSQPHLMAIAREMHRMFGN